MIIHEQLTYRSRFLKTVQMYIHRSRNKYYPIRLNYYFCPKGDFILYYFWDLIEIWVSEQCIYLQTLFKASSWGKTDYLGFICETVEESLETPLYGNKTFSNANPITDMTISICSPTQVHIFRRITFSTFMNIDQLKAKKVSSHGNFMEVIFINFTYSAKIYHSWIQSLFSLSSSYTHISHESVHQMATNNMLHTLNLDFFNDLLANQIFLYANYLQDIEITMAWKLLSFVNVTFPCGTPNRRPAYVMCVCACVIMCMCHDVYDLYSY